VAHSGLGEGGDVAPFEVLMTGQLADGHHASRGERLQVEGMSVRHPEFDFGALMPAALGDDSTRGFFALGAGSSSPYA
jgi:hypothetical protein